MVGNDSYRSPRAQPLKNAINDAKAIRALLENDLGFKTTLLLDADRRTLNQAILDLTNRIQAEDIVLFFYAGHGGQHAGENFLIPTDFNGASPLALADDAISVARIQDRLSKSRASVLLIDACRDNIFGQRGGSRGLAPQAETRGTLIGFAAAAGETASDNPDGRNGLFTSALLEVLREPGIGFKGVLQRVRTTVYARSNGQQFPAIYDGLLGDIPLRNDTPASELPRAGAAVTTAGWSVDTDLNDLIPTTPVPTDTSRLRFLDEQRMWSVESREPLISRDGETPHETMRLKVVGGLEFIIPRLDEYLFKRNGKHYSAYGQDGAFAGWLTLAPKDPGYIAQFEWRGGPTMYYRIEPHLKGWSVYATDGPSLASSLQRTIPGQGGDPSAQSEALRKYYGVGALIGYGKVNVDDRESLDRLFALIRTEPDWALVAVVAVVEP